MGELFFFVNGGEENGLYSWKNGGSMSSEGEKKVVAKQLGVFEDDGGPGKRSDTETVDVPVTLELGEREGDDEDVSGLGDNF